MKHDCQATEPLLSGYLDGELTQADRQRVELILEDCEQCAGAHAEMKQLRQGVGGIAYEQLTETERSTMSKNLTSRAGASIGQVLFLVGLILVYGTIVFTALKGIIMDPESSLWIKIGLPGLFVGLAILFFTVLFQRMKAAKTDKYKDVEI